MSVIATQHHAPERLLPAVSIEEADAFATAQRGALRNRLQWFFHNAGHHQGTPCRLDSPDLDLLEQGFICRIPANTFLGGGASYTITPLGEAMALALRARRRRQRAPHHTLGNDLAVWLVGKQRLTWENSMFRLGDAVRGLEVRPDVFSIIATLNPARMDPVVHEIKVSRADFWADVNDPAKRAGYFTLAPRVVYATPKGLLKPGEVPSECGWLEQDGDEWCLRQRGQKNKAWKPWGGHTWLNLVLKTHQKPNAANTV